ncbi:unnamed protein product, partial [Symbiodinium microadriaticum]
LFHRCLQRDADQHLISKLAEKLLEPESDAGPAERRQEDNWDTGSTDAVSPGGSDSDNEDADWIFVRDAAEDANDERQRAGDRQATTLADLSKPSLEEPIVMEGVGDHSCDVPEGCPVAPTTPLSTAQCQETPSDEPPKKRPSLLSTAAPDDSDQEIEDEECSCDASSGSEDAQDGGRESGGNRQALAKPEDVDQHVCMDEGRSTGSREGSVDASIQTDGDDCTVCGPLQETSAMLGSTLSFHSQTELADVEAGGGECTPSDLHVANLLPYLTVRDLLNWRLLSRRTRSPKVLIEHVAEMGSLDRPESISAFVEKMDMIGPFLSETFDASFAAAFEGNAEQQKLYECRWWCMKLASKRQTHFAESHVQRIVGKNLQSLFRHRRSEDADVAVAAGYLVWNYAFDVLPFAQQPIVAATLDLMEELMRSDIRASLPKIYYCINALAMVLRSLGKPQRQKWASLMVQLLMNPDVPKGPVIWRLKMLWLADDDPIHTYAEAQQLLPIVLKSSTDLQTDIRFLMHCSCS